MIASMRSERLLNKQHCERAERKVEDWRIYWSVTMQQSRKLPFCELHLIHECLKEIKTENKGHQFAVRSGNIKWFDIKE